MTDYRRNRVPGGTYFFTVNLNDRRGDLLVREIEVLREVVRGVKARRPFHIDAWVVLPEHMHCLWTLPEGDEDYSARWRDIKKGFSKRITGGEAISASRREKHERGIWQRRFWEHTIQDERDYAMHMDYVHFNPVKHGLVKDVADWRYSSFHRCVALGIYGRRWEGSGEAVVEAGEFVDLGAGGG